LHGHDGLLATTAPQDRLARGAQVAYPVDLPERGEHVLTAAAFHQCNREGVQLTARPAAHREQHLRAHRHAHAKEAPDQGVEEGDNGGDPGSGENCVCCHCGWLLVLASSGRSSLVKPGTELTRAM